MTPEAVYKQITGKDQPAGRRYLRLEVSGATIPDGTDFAMPTVKYYFM